MSNKKDGNQQHKALSWKRFHMVLPQNFIKFQSYQVLLVRSLSPFTYLFLMVLPAIRRRHGAPAYAFQWCQPTWRWTGAWHLVEPDHPSTTSPFTPKRLPSLRMLGENLEILAVSNPPQKKTPKYQGEMMWNVIFKNINWRIFPFHLFRFVSDGFLVVASWRTQCHVPPYLVLMVPPNPDSRGLELFLASKSSIKDGTKNHSNGQTPVN